MSVCQSAVTAWVDVYTAELANGTRVRDVCVAVYATR
mgnify:CR=1 FL=1